MSTLPAERKSLKYIHDDVEFLSHQVEGVRRMVRLDSFLLADEMGLGKSLQALTVAAVDFEKGWAQRILIVCPATLKSNWSNEIEKFTSFSDLVLEGTPIQREAKIAEYRREGFDVFIVNYEQVIKHVDELNSLEFDIVIFDEAHYLKNPKSKRTKACMQLRAGRSFLLTGSPLLNQVNELWALLHRIDPVSWPNYWRFVSRYCKFGGYQDKEIIGVKNRDELYEKLQSIMVRRLKRDVMDLPPKQEIEVIVDMSPLQKRMVDQAEKEMQIDLSGGALEIENVLVKMLRIKQILGTPASVGEKDESPRLSRAVEMIVDIIETGEPVTVWSQFLSVLDAMERRLILEGIDFRRIDGSVPPGERAPIVKAWSEDATRGRPQALLLMLDSQARVAGTGLNMTAASKTIFLDRLYVPKLNEQAEDRHHRIGQNSTVQIFVLTTKNTIERRIAQLIARKRELFDDMVESQAPQAGVTGWKAALYEVLIKKEQNA